MPHTILRLPAIKAITGLSRCTIYTCALPKEFLPSQSAWAVVPLVGLPVKWLRLTPPAFPENPIQRFANSWCSCKRSAKQPHKPRGSLPPEDPFGSANIRFAAGWVVLRKRF